MSADPVDLVEFITDALRTEVHRVGVRRVVVALDGRSHATIVAALAARALGAAQVHALLFPTGNESRDSAVERTANAIGISIESIALDGFVAALRSISPAADRARRDAFALRTRGALVLDAAARRDALVIGSRSKTDRLLGLGVPFADPCAIDPIGDLWGSEVRALAAPLGLDDADLGEDPPIDLPAAAGEGGTLDGTYSRIDALLRLLIDGHFRRREIVERTDYARADLQRVGAAIRASRARRTMEIIPQLSARPIGTDLQTARDANT